MKLVIAVWMIGLVVIFGLLNWEDQTVLSIEEQQYLEYLESIGASDENVRWNQGN